MKFPRRVGEFPCLSRNSKVIPAPSTGKVVINRTETTNIAHEIKQNSRDEFPADLAITSETTNVMAPNSEDNPRT